MSAKQSPPNATAVARSSTTRPGSCRARAGRHPANAADSARSRPDTPALCRINTAPAEQTSDSRTESRTRPENRLLFT
jgi:hypothetical protein